MLHLRERLRAVGGFARQLLLTQEVGLLTQGGLAQDGSAQDGSAQDDSAQDGFARERSAREYG